MFIHGCLFSSLVDLTMSATDPASVDREKRTIDGRTHGGSSNRATGFTRIERYGPLMMFACLDGAKDEIVAVERPLLKIMEGLPDGFLKKTHWG